MSIWVWRTIDLLNELLLYFFSSCPDVFSQDTEKPLLLSAEHSTYFGPESVVGVYVKFNKFNRIIKPIRIKKEKNK